MRKSTISRARPSRRPASIEIPIAVVILLSSCCLLRVVESSFMSSKRIACGSVEVDEDTLLDHHHNHHNQRRHQHQHNAATLRLVANLTHCLHVSREHNYTSFRSMQSSKLATHIFDAHFQLNESTGLVYLKHEIDRERLCVDIKSDSATSPANNNPSSLTITSNHVADPSSLNCDCKSERCELNLKFIGFKDPLAAAAAAASLSKRRRIQHAQSKSSDQEYKYLSVRVLVRDRNDHKPRFRAPFLDLNITEHLGPQQVSSDDVRGGGGQLNSEKSKKCANIKLYSGGRGLVARESDENGEEEEREDDGYNNERQDDLNSLLALDRAYDLDTGANARIRYKLFLLNNNESRLFDDLLLVSGDASLSANDDVVARRTERVRRFLAGRDAMRSCARLFELVETSSSSSSASSLFLRINTYLDREVQQV